jgi:hypothetical protein
MGLVAQLFGSGAEKNSVSLQGNGEYGVDVDCEGHHQAALETIARRTPDEVCEVPCRATLVPEPSGRVSVRVRDQVVGYLKDEIAADYVNRAEAIGAQSSAVCDAMIVGGWCGHDGEEGTFGVKLDVVLPLKVADRNSSPRST